MSDDIKSGLEGVVAFATEIAEADRDGGSLRYRGVDIEELVGKVPFEQVWGLLVDGTLEPGLPPAEPHPLGSRSGDPRVDVQAALAILGPEWGFQSLIDISDEQARDDLARASVMALSFVAQSARGTGRPPVPQREVDKAGSIPERFLIRWRGEADPDHVKAIDAYWIAAAEHGMNASTFTARVIASTGADVAAALSGAVGALSGPLHGGAPARVLKMLDEVEASGDAQRWVERALDGGERLMGFGHRVYRAEDPRAVVLRRTSQEIGSMRFDVAEALERAALAELKARKPDRVLATNVEFWSAVLLDHAERAGLAVHEPVHLRAHGRLVGAHPRAEARGTADPAVGEVRRAGRAPAVRRLSQRALQDVAQGRGVGVGEARERRGRNAHAALDLGARGDPLVGQDERLDAAVVLSGAALDEAMGLEPVGDPSDVRVVAHERLRERAHRHRLPGLQVRQRHRLHRREPEFV